MVRTDAIIGARRASDLALLVRRRSSPLGDSLPMGASPENLPAGGTLPKMVSPGEAASRQHISIYV